MEIRKFTENTGGRDKTHWLLIFTDERERDIVLRSLVAKYQACGEGGKWYIHSKGGDELPPTGVILDKADAEVRQDRYGNTKTLPVAIRIEPTAYSLADEIAIALGCIAAMAETWAAKWRPLLDVFDIWAGAAQHEHKDVAGEIKAIGDRVYAIERSDEEARRETMRTNVRMKNGYPVSTAPEDWFWAKPRDLLATHDEAIDYLIDGVAQQTRAIRELRHRMSEQETDLAALKMHERSRWPHRLRHWWATRHQSQPKKEVPPVNEPVDDPEVDYDGNEF